MSRKNARTLWAEHLQRAASPAASGKTLPASPARSSPALPHPDHFLQRQSFRGLILAVDPSLRGTGLALLECASPNRFRLLHSETLRLPPALPMPDCLASISRAVTRQLQTYPVGHAALEQTIYVQNNQTAQILGAARGAIIAAIALAGIPVFEYPPLRVKQAVVGFGRASKVQVAKTVRSLLQLPEVLPLDEADAAAVGLCHAFTWRG